MVNYVVWENSAPIAWRSFPSSIYLNNNQRVIRVDTEREIMTNEHNTDTMIGRTIIYLVPEWVTHKERGCCFDSRLVYSGVTALRGHCLFYINRKCGLVDYKTVQGHPYIFYVKYVSSQSISPFS